VFYVKGALMIAMVLLVYYIYIKNIGLKNDIEIPRIN